MHPDAKYLAFKVLDYLVGEKAGKHTLKYFTGRQLMWVVQQHTTDPKLAREVFHQSRRALNKLGYHQPSWCTSFYNERKL